MSVGVKDLDHRMNKRSGKQTDKSTTVALLVDLDIIQSIRAKRNINSTRV
jgi:hypothetical protein